MRGVTTQRTSAWTSECFGMAWVYTGVPFSVMRIATKPTSGSWVKDAEALIEMGASSVDIGTVRGLVEAIQTPDKKVAEQILSLDTELLATALFGEDRSPMMWHRDVARDVLKVIAAMATKTSFPEALKILPLKPHPLEDAGDLYNEDPRLGVEDD